jgi:hypothetical protein
MTGASLAHDTSGRRSNDDLDDHARCHGFDSAHLIVIAGQPNSIVRQPVEQYALVQGVALQSPACSTAPISTPSISL